MAKLTLTIKSTYVPTWGLFEGLREVLQNAEDARRMYGAEVKIEHAPRSGRLTVTSTGASIDARALLLGHSDKIGRSDAIGGKAEGLKLALVALTRAGNDVTIRTADEVWTCSFEAAAEFGGEKLLTVWTRKRPGTANEVSVTIEGVTKEAWAEISRKFLFVTPPAGKVAETAYGRVLFAPEYAGKIFVKGIFVQTLDKVSYGYDLNNIEVDRDRKMVSIYDAEIHCSLAISEVARHDKDAQKGLYENLRAGHIDGAGMSSMSLPAEALDAIAGMYEGEFGPTAYPVLNEDEAKQVRSRGGHAVVTPKPLLEAVRRRKGDLHSHVSKLADSRESTVDLGMLTDAEMSIYTTAHEQVNRALRAMGFDEVQATVVTFRDDGKLATHDPNTGEICISHTLLGVGLPAVVRALVHEAAHRVSRAGDGDLRHVDMIEQIWMAVFIDATRH